MKIDNFFAELKRRNVYKVAIAYAIVAWLLIQAASILFPTFEAPAWVMKVFVTVIAAGFPVALVIAWAFEMTPEGMKRTENVSPNEFIPQWSRRKFATLIVSVALVAAGLLIFQLWRTQSSSMAASVPQKSIAVLPFDNLSRDPDNAYFAEGVQDEILTRLAKIADLKVISRTSTQRYKSSPDNLPLIAKQLGVTNILEGSVQKSADQVRVNVQLINALTDAHLWAETYDRKLSDIFKLETEIAKMIAESLQAKLTGREQKAINIKPTSNPDAYDAYLRGLASERRSEQSPDAMLNSGRFYRQAVKLDPNFAWAWARLTIAECSVYFGNFNRTPKQLAAAREAAETAFKLSPDSGEGHFAQGYYLYYCLSDYPAARKSFEEAHRLLPNSGDVLQAISFIDRRQGKWQDALAHQAAAIELDPRNPQILYETGLTHFWIGDLAGAREMLDRGLSIAPDDAEMIAIKASTYQAEGNLPTAAKLLDPLPPLPGDPRVFGVQMLQLLYQRRYESVIEELKKTVANPPSIGHLVGDYYVLLGLAQQRSGDANGARATYLAAKDKLEGLRRNEQDAGWLAGNLGVIYAALGDRAASLREAETLAKLATNNVPQFTRAARLRAEIAAQFGDADNALANLSGIIGKPTGGFRLAHGPLTPALLRLDPVWDPVRSDPRFQKLCEEAKP